MNADDAVLALAALAQGSRLAIYRLLVEAGPQGLAAGRIAEATGSPASSLSFHLKELSRAGLVDARAEGRYVIYTANFPRVQALVGFLTENCCGGEPCGASTPVLGPLRRSAAGR